MIIEKQPILPFSYVISNPGNLNILAFCYFKLCVLQKRKQSSYWG